MSKQLNKQQKRVKTLALHLSIILMLILVLFPVFYIISISFNPIGGVGSDLIPTNFTLNHWRYILGLEYIDPLTSEIKRSSFPILTWFFNSIKIASITSILMLALSTTSAYALSRFSFKGKQATLITLMIVQMFPSIMSMIAFYFMLNFIGNYVPWLGTDSHGGLILVYLGGTPFNIWLIKGYFDSIPKSLEESAIMDGCNHFQAFYKIILPLSEN